MAKGREPKRSPTKRSPSGRETWVGHVLAVPLPRRAGFGAIQVVPSAGSGLAAVALDGFWPDRPPTLEEALRAGPLRRSESGSLVAVNASEPKPFLRYADLGAGPLCVAEGDLVIDSYGSLAGFPVWIDGVRRWRLLSEDERAARRARAWRHDATPVELRLGSRLLSVRADSRHLRIAPPEVPGSERIDWSELDRLPHLTELAYQGGDGSVLDAVRRRPHLRRLELDLDGAREVDLSGCALSFLSVSSEVEALVVDESLETIALRAPSPRLAVEGPGSGRDLSVSVSGLTEIPPAIPGLGALRSYHQGGLRRARISTLLPYEALVDLRLDGAPGEVEDVEALAGLAALEDLVLHDFYALDADRFPTAEQAPSLANVAVWGYRASQEATLRRRLASYWLRELRGKKQDAWIAANLDNPFRDWVDRDARVGKAASTLYRKALAEAKRAADAAALRAVVEAFVAGLNRLDAKGSFDTIDREDCFGALGKLLAEANPPADAAALEALFDRLREF